MRKPGAVGVHAGDLTTSISRAVTKVFPRATFSAGFAEPFVLRVTITRPWFRRLAATLLVSVRREDEIALRTVRILSDACRPAYVRVLIFLV